MDVEKAEHIKSLCRHFGENSLYRSSIVIADWVVLTWASLMLSIRMLYRYKLVCKSQHLTIICSAENRWRRSCCRSTLKNLEKWANPEWVAYGELVVNCNVFGWLENCVKSQTDKTTFNSSVDWKKVLTFAGDFVFLVCRVFRVSSVWHYSRLIWLI